MVDSDDESPPDLIDTQNDESQNPEAKLIKKVPISIITGKKVPGFSAYNISRIRSPIHPKTSYN